MRWLVGRSVRRAPMRLVLGALSVAFPVAMLAATLFFVNLAVRSMTRVALEPTQVEMRALATTLNADMSSIDQKLAAVPGVRGVDRFAAADVIVSPKGGGAGATARLFAVDPSYFAHHPWVKDSSGSLSSGALLSQSLRSVSGFASAKALTVQLSGRNKPLPLTLPVSGSVDLRQAAPTFFAVPTGDVQGDIAQVPRSLVIDYATFEKSILPEVKKQLGTQTPVLNPGLTDLPPVTVESHVTVDHAAYPSDPSNAVTWSGQMKRLLERQAPAQIVVADNTAQPLIEASQDSTNAKILFILLGIPGFLVAAALGIAAQSALTEAQRREDALLALRGATGGQLARLAIAHSVLAGAIGSAVGLVVAALAVSLVDGHPVWTGLSPGGMIASALIAVLAGGALTAIRAIGLARASRATEVISERRLLERGWNPGWRRLKLDLIAIVAGLLILGIDAASGGLKHSPIEGSTLGLSFYVLLAPILLWVGVTLLAVRGLLAALARWARADRGRPLTSWRGATLRWLGRRPARTAVALVLGVLAVGFGSYVLSFVDTYGAAKTADRQAAFGSDLRLTPNVDPYAPGLQAGAPQLGAAGVATPIRFVPVRVGSDRKTALSIDPATYRRATTAPEQIASGGGLDALSKTPGGVLIAPEIADSTGLGPGDTLPLTVFPDDLDKSRNISLKIVGIFRSVPPSDPISELVISNASQPSQQLPPADFYLANTTAPPAQAAASLRAGPVGKSFAVTTEADLARTHQRSLTALNLGGLGTIEAVGSGLIAAIGVAILGAFLVLERRRELAILESIGADRSEALTGPVLEGVVTVAGGIAIGSLLGIGLSVIAVRVLGLFFTLPPPLVTIPVGRLALFALAVVTASAIAFWAALASVRRDPAAKTLREA